ncbi:MAG: dihydrodipicolinate synthase family protein [Bacteroidetes bacterium]|nr:MAG: dihydrodipicolinate synthase family protein [Bacteroidota bacterium]
MIRPLNGVIAALLTPVDARGRAYPASLPALIDFVLERGVRGICVGGGTSEYPRFSVDERKRLLTTAAEHLNGVVPLIAAIGAATLREVIALGRHALTLGCDALLLPPPHFYRYAQEDLEAFYRAAAEALPGSILLYDLAGFTGNPIELDTRLRLMTEVDNIVGVKDSSGRRAYLRPLAEARGALPSPITLLAGSDGLFREALEHGWDGCISGIATCFPELLVAIDDACRAGDEAVLARAQASLEGLIERIEALPFPWLLREASALRGLPVGPLGWPLSPGRLQQIEALRAEMPAWFAEALPGIAR